MTVDLDAARTRAKDLRVPLREDLRWSNGYLAACGDALDALADELEIERGDHPAIPSRKELAAQVSRLLSEIDRLRKIEVAARTYIDELHSIDGVGDFVALEDALAGSSPSATSEQR